MQLKFYSIEFETLVYRFSLAPMEQYMHLTSKNLNSRNGEFRLGCYCCHIPYKIQKTLNLLIDIRLST